MFLTLPKIELQGLVNLISGRVESTNVGGKLLEVLGMGHYKTDMVCGGKKCVRVVTPEEEVLELTFSGDDNSNNL